MTLDPILYLYMWAESQLAKIMYNNIIQVAALAPLVLLLVLEPRCDHLVVAHLN